MMQPHEAQGLRVGKTMCPYCGVGCLLDVATQHNKVVELRGDPDSPVNYGLLCPKGALLSPVLDLPGRLHSPQRRTNSTHSLHNSFENISWDTALTEVAQKLGDIIKQHGPDSVALYGSGQL